MATSVIIRPNTSTPVGTKGIFREVVNIDGQPVDDSMMYVLPVHSMKDVKSAPYRNQEEAQASSTAAGRLLGLHPGIERVTFGALDVPGKGQRDFVTFTRHRVVNNRAINWFHNPEKMAQDPQRVELEPLYLPMLDQLVGILQSNPQLALVRHQFLQASKTLDTRIDAYLQTFEAIGRPISVEEAIIRSMIDETNEVFGTHGGEAEFKGFENGIAHLFLQGACKTCVSSAQSIEKRLDERMRSFERLKGVYKRLNVMNRPGAPK